MSFKRPTSASCWAFSHRIKMFHLITIPRKRITSFQQSRSKLMNTIEQMHSSSTTINQISLDYNSSRSLVVISKVWYRLQPATRTFCQPLRPTLLSLAGSLRPSLIIRPRLITPESPLSLRSGCLRPLKIITRTEFLCLCVCVFSNPPWQRLFPQ